MIGGIRKSNGPVVWRLSWLRSSRSVHCFAAKTVAGVIALATLSNGCTTRHHSIQQQEQADLSETEREFLKFHLFAEGRGMVVSPRLTDKYETQKQSLLWPVIRGVAERRNGLIATPEGDGFVGLNLVAYQDTRVGVFGCAVCHSGKAAGRFIPGLGNKNFDTYGGGQTLWSQLAHDRRDLAASRLTGARKRATEGSLHYATVLTQKTFANRTQGLVPTALVWDWTFQAADNELPAEMRVPGQVKVPHLWGYASKREAGLFCDGFAYGKKSGWLAAVPLTAGLSPQAVRDDYPKLLALEQVLARFEPPAHPFRIDEEKRTRGAAVYSANCRECHGSYRPQEEGAAVYRKPKWVSIDRVGTDPERLLILEESFFQSVSRNPLRDILRTNRHGKGYLAPRLEGIWARFPYLHNASVPSLAAMLTPPDQRPDVFSLKDAGEAHRFDPETVGLTVPRPHSLHAWLLRSEARNGSRRIYDTARSGHSNQGHGFGTTLPEADKAALIEYLKSL